MDDVLGVEFEIEPGAAIGNDARREQELARGMGLALVVVEEDARRAVHLGDDDTLGPVDDEGAVRSHERHVAHIDILLLDVFDRLGAGILVDFEHDQTQRHLEWRRIGHAALLTFIYVIFWRLEFIADEFQHGLTSEVADRENRPEDGLQAFTGPTARRFLDLQELIVRFFLNFDEIRHFRDFCDLAKKLTNPFATCDSLRFSHVSSFVSKLFQANSTAYLKPSSKGFKKAVATHQFWITGSASPDPVI